MIKILVKSSEGTGFGWKSDNNIFVRGYAYVGEKYHSADELIAVFSKVKDEKDLKHIANELNGLFSSFVSKNLSNCSRSTFVGGLNENSPTPLNKKAYSFPNIGWHKYMLPVFK